MLYADPGPSVCEVNKLLQSVERELIELDMAINASKSCSVRVGPRFDVSCWSITSLSGVKIPWVDKMRYLGVFIV